MEFYDDATGITIRQSPILGKLFDLKHEIIQNNVVIGHAALSIFWAWVSRWWEIRMELNHSAFSVIFDKVRIGGYGGDIIIRQCRLMSENTELAKVDFALHEKHPYSITWGSKSISLRTIEPSYAVLLDGREIGRFEFEGHLYQTAHFHLGQTLPVEMQVFIYYSFTRWLTYFGGTRVN